MPRKKNEFTDALVAAPFWISLVIALVGYIFLGSILPHISFENPIIKGIANAGIHLAPLVAIFFVFIAIVSFFRGLRVKKQFEKQKSIDSLNQLSWKEFEDITAEYFRRQGYKVEENMRAGADGGVDVWLRKNEEFTIVQCKQWKNKKVPLKDVRELLGAITAESASSGILVTSSTFTSDAIKFAREQNIQLIDGATFTAGIGQIQNGGQKLYACDSAPTESTEDSAPLCPRCGALMVMRTAKKGPNAGNQFWGCPSFPNCRSTREI
ncbi:MAG: DUF2034 domain-containing protein [Akkermansiaceae bacterium]